MVESIIGTGFLNAIAYGRWVTAAVEPGQGDWKNCVSLVRTAVTCGFAPPKPARVLLGFHVSFKPRMVSQLRDTEMSVAHPPPRKAENAIYGLVSELLQISFYAADVPQHFHQYEIRHRPRLLDSDWPLKKALLHTDAIIY
mmetsp:Transcript_41914/g.164269  ORF Transcript_41914/g.164269 Transcript_41914/m.164269 type:complete len:141 (-) Transcript_41914:3308-3730(-)